MQTFKFNDVKIGYDDGCYVTVRAEDAHAAMKRLAKMHEEKLREGPRYEMFLMPVYVRWR
jgi:hypothetical protein